MLLVGIILVLMVVGFNAIQFQEDAQECKRGGHNVQCPEEVHEWPEDYSSTSTPSRLG